jgi:hypothetical protein
MTTERHKAKLLPIIVLLAILLSLPQSLTHAQETSHTFPETGKTASGIFLQYWTTHGGLAQQGYPISDEMMLASTDGKEYRTQFFQRAVFEQHAEFAGTPNEVLLKLVGQTFYEHHFQTTPPPNQAVNPTNTITFKETGHSTGGKFRDYWEKHGGLAQQGYPMTDEFKMVSTDGKEYTTQVFQRAVFELHPEFAGTENEVLLRLLGVEELEALKNPAATLLAGRPHDAGEGWEIYNSDEAFLKFELKANDPTARDTANRMDDMLGSNTKFTAIIAKDQADFEAIAKAYGFEPKAEPMYINSNGESIVVGYILQSDIAGPSIMWFPDRANVAKMKLNSLKLTIYNSTLNRAIANPNPEQYKKEADRLNNHPDIDKIAASFEVRLSK